MIEVMRGCGCCFGEPDVRGLSADDGRLLQRRTILPQVADEPEMDASGREGQVRQTQRELSDR